MALSIRVLCRAADLATLSEVERLDLLVICDLLYPGGYYTWTDPGTGDLMVGEPEWARPREPGAAAETQTQ